MAEKKRAEVDEEGLEVGRLLGAASRWGSQQLISELRLLAKKKKKKTYEILAEAIELYKMLDEVEHIDPKHLVIATMFLERQLELAIRLVASASSLFASELVQSIMQTYQKLDEARAQGPKAREQPQPELDMRSMIMPYVVSILQGLLTRLTGAQLPTTTGALPKVKIIE